MMPDISEAAARSIQAVVGLAALVVAAVAVYISARVEQRANARFKEQQALAQRMAEANVRPILDIRHVRYEDLKAVRLVNHGLGTAVITRVHVERQGKHVNQLVEVFNFPNVRWDTFRRFDRDEPSYLSLRQANGVVVS